MSRISTGTGDDGTTGLVGGRRVPKTSARVAAYGAVDEANDALGVAVAFADDPALAALLRSIQHDLFNLGADLATPEGAEGALRVTEADVARIGAETDRLEAELPPLRHFILPGGTPAAAFLHLARATTRRAEREAWALREVEPVNPHALVYLNRLSDLLFLLARRENVRAGKEESQWLGKAGAARKTAENPGKS